ncbi:hypothetical protein ACA910_019552 [Epithemia clementina (nom. ined.)]
MEQLEDRIRQLKADMPNIMDNLEHICQCSNLHMDEDPTESTEIRRRDLRSIHFNLSSANRDKRAQYGRYITGDMRKRHMDIMGTLEERQEKLMSQLMSEYNLLALTQNVKDWNDLETAAALVILMESVPCILHLENRVGLKLLYLWLRQGLANAKGD